MTLRACRQVDDKSMESMREMHGYEKTFQEINVEANKVYRRPCSVC
jgi:hypothetical protein